MPRRPSRIMTSPGRTGRPVLCQHLAAIAASRGSCRAMARATRRSGSSLVRGARRAAARARRPAPRSAGRGQRPQLDQPRIVGALGVVVQARPGSTTPPCASGSANTASTSRQDRRHRAERAVEQLGPDRPAGGRGPRRQPLAHRAEVGEVGTLEAVDRLLLVADHEQGARPVARAGAGEELLGQLERRSPTAAGWCPAPRRPAHGRCARRACRAPTRSCPAGAAAHCVRSIRSS